MDLLLTAFYSKFNLEGNKKELTKSLTSDTFEQHIEFDSCS